MAPRTGTVRRRTRRAEATAAQVLDSAAQEAAETLILGPPAGSAGARFVEDRLASSPGLLSTKPRTLQPTVSLLRNESVLRDNENVRPLWEACSAVRKRRRMLRIRNRVRSDSRKAHDAATGKDVWPDITREKTPEDNNDADWWKTKAKKSVSINDSRIPTGFAPVPDHALSVNPLREAHQDRIGELVAAEVRQKDEDALVRAKLFPQVEDGSVPQAPTDGPTYDDQEDPSSRQLFGRPMGERLTQAQRNKQLRKKATVREEKQRERSKSLARDIAHLEILAAEVDEKIDATGKSQKRDERDRTRRLGGRIIPALPKSVALTNELGMSLRDTSVQNDLVRDHFIAMQHRGLIEPHLSRPVGRKRRVVSARFPGQGILASSL